MMQQLRKAAPKLRLTLGCSTFVPKAHTPFQWYGVSADGDRRLKRLERTLGREGVDFRPESYKWSVVQALLSRGDRRLTRLLLLVRQYGDSLGSFRRAFKELQVGSGPGLGDGGGQRAVRRGCGRRVVNAEAASSLPAASRCVHISRHDKCVAEHAGWAPPHVLHPPLLVTPPQGELPPMEHYTSARYDPAGTGAGKLAGLGPAARSPSDPATPPLLRC
jgi:hypothetical protein